MDLHQVLRSLLPSYQGIVSCITHELVLFTAWHGSRPGHDFRSQSHSILFQLNRNQSQIMIRSADNWNISRILQKIKILWSLLSPFPDRWNLTGHGRERLTQLSATIGNKLARGGYLARSLALRLSLTLINTVAMKSPRKLGTRICICWRGGWVPCTWEPHGMGVSYKFIASAVWYEK